MNEKILIISNDYEYITRISSVLLDNGYVIFPISDVGNFLEYADRIIPDLFICDDRINNANGLDVVKKIISNERLLDIPVLYSTEKRSVIHIRKIALAGADSFIFKDSSEEEFLFLIETRLRKHIKNKNCTPNNKLAYNKRIIIDTPSETKIIKLSDIVGIKAEDIYSQVFLIDGKKNLIRRSLKEWESILPDDEFIRISRKYIVNLNHIEKIARQKSTSYILKVLSLSEFWEVSRRYSVNLKEKIDVLSYK